MASKLQRSAGKPRRRLRQDAVGAPTGHSAAPGSASARPTNDGFFTDEIDAMQRRLESLRQQAAAVVGDNELLASALEELSTTLEELQVSAAELHQKSEELAAANHALALESQHYVELFEEAPDPYLATDSAGLIVEANHAAATVLRRQRNALVGKPLTVFVAPEGRRAFLARLSQLRASDAPAQRWELRIRPHQGPIFYAAVSVTAVRRPSGDLVRIRWLLRDVTERKSAETLAASTRRGVENIMESIPDVLYVLDMETRLVRWNRRLEIVTGFAREVLARLRASDLVVDDARPTLEHGIGQALATGFAQSEVRLRGKDGGVPSQCITVPLRNWTGAI